MENFDFPSAGAQKGDNLSSNPLDSHSPIRRELDSLDDFEHLDHENQAVDNESQLLDFLKSDVSQIQKNQNLGLLDDLKTSSSDIQDKFASGTHKDPFFSELDALSGNNSRVPNIVDTTKSFMDFEREQIQPTNSINKKSSDYDFKEEHPQSTDLDDDEHYDDESDFKDFSKQKDDFEHHVKSELDEFKDFAENDNMSFIPSKFNDESKDKPVDQMRNLLEETINISEPIPVLQPKSEIPQAFKLESETIVKSTKEMKPEPVKEFKPEPVKEFKPEPVKEFKPEPVKETKPPVKEEIPVKIPSKPVATKEQHDVIAAEVMFCQMGLDAWFNPERLNPKVESLIYWRCPRKSGIVFGVSLALLLALSCFSLISVLAYASLTAVCGCMAFRIYRNVLQAIQKTSDGHPFKQLLETDVSVSQEKAQQVASVTVTHLNAAVTELRRLFLVEDLVDSTKFIVLLWCLTYLGAWFNGMTLIIIAFVALFTLPKVYETNKTQIDANLDVVRSKLQEITSKVKAAVPIGKKAESDKDK